MKAIMMTLSCSLKINLNAIFNSPINIVNTISIGNTDLGIVCTRNC